MLLARNLRFLRSFWKHPVNNRSKYQFASVGKYSMQLDYIRKNVESSMVRQRVANSPPRNATKLPSNNRSKHQIELTVLLINSKHLPRGSTCICFTFIFILFYLCLFYFYFILFYFILLFTACPTPPLLCVETDTASLKGTLYANSSLITHIFDAVVRSLWLDLATGNRIVVGPRSLWMTSNCDVVWPRTLTWIGN